MESEVHLKLFLCSCSRQGFGDRVLLFAEDQEAFDHIDSRWPGHVITYNYSSIPRAGESAHDFGSLGFFLMTERRPDYLRAVLRLGVNVLYNDLDMVWLKNPFPAFTGDYDVWVNDDWTDDTGHAAVHPLQPDRRFPSHYHPNICR
jgi:rhamnogalacturonan II specific xylosyltransferase